MLFAVISSRNLGAPYFAVLWKLIGLIPLFFYICLESPDRVFYGFLEDGFADSSAF